MNTPTPLDYITAIGAIATPVLVLILTAVGWTIRNKIERTHELEEKLREDRIKVYNEILEPFIILLTKDEAFANRKAYQGKSKVELGTEKIISLPYRQAAFKMVLMGSDNVVKSYNNLMQFFYSQGAEQQEKDIKKIMSLLGGFLLAIRKSVGNENTSLDNLEMLEWLISDVKALRD